MDLETRTTELLQRLVRFKTVNPPGDEQACQEWLKEELEAAGFSVELLADIPGRPNLVATLDSGKSGPTLCLLGHVDTVLADPSEWEVDPWCGDVRDDGCLWGRGTLDMKSQVAAELAAVLELRAGGWSPRAGVLKVVFTADEEVGAVHGAQWLCREHPDKVRADIVINEGAGQVFEYKGRRVYGVCCGEKGVFRFRLGANGTAGHASLPRIGDNALVKLAPALSAMADGRIAQLEHSPEPDAFITSLGEDPSDLAAALAAIESEDPRVAVMLEPMLGITLAPTMAAASEKVNVIPSRAYVKVDCRVPPGIGHDQTLGVIRATVGDELDVDFAEEIVGNRSPIDTPLMEQIRAFVKEEDRDADVTPVVLAGFSDSHWFRAAFPDCVAYGFFPQKAMDVFEAAPLVHGANERIPVADLGLAARFYRKVVEETL